MSSSLGTRKSGSKPVGSKGKGKKSSAGDAAEGQALAQMPLGKQLAHTDKTVRDLGIRNLEAFLSRTDGEHGGYVPLPEKEMAKLWKGLFYCFWMSDKPLVQQALATDLANMILRINPVGAEEGSQLSAALGFLDGFWVALVREWNGIDRLRMDKFYMLIRRYINATFRLLAREDWSKAAIDGVNRILSGTRGPMTWQDRSVPTSLATHIADVYLDELDKVMSEDGMSPAPVVALLGPHIALLARTRGQVVHKRLMTVVFSPLLAALAEGGAEEEEEERPAKRRKGQGTVSTKGPPATARSVSATGEFASVVAKASLQPGGEAVPKAQVRTALLAAMFKAAANEEAVESNRRKIYALVRAEGDDDGDDDE